MSRICLEESTSSFRIFFEEDLDPWFFNSSQIRLVRFQPTNEELRQATCFVGQFLWLRITAIDIKTLEYVFDSFEMLEIRFWSRKIHLFFNFFQIDFFCLVCFSNDATVALLLRWPRKQQKTSLPLKTKFRFLNFFGTLRSKTISHFEADTM